MFAASFAPVRAQEEQKVFSGQDVYRLWCIVCHGPRGQGSPLGKALTDVVALNRSDDEIFQVIFQGRASTGMTAFGEALADEEIHNVVGYVRELQGRSVERAAKQKVEVQQTVASIELARKGEEIFTGKANCIKCHSYATRGGMLGPALDGVSKRLTPELLREAVADPSKTIATGFETKVVETKDGATITGLFRNENQQSFQLLSDDGLMWRIYYKKDLKLVRDLTGSYMPHDAYDALSQEEKDALIAFVGAL